MDSLQRQNSSKDQLLQSYRQQREARQRRRKQQQLKQRLFIGAAFCSASYCYFYYGAVCFRVGRHLDRICKQKTSLQKLLTTAGSP